MLVRVTLRLTNYIANPYWPQKNRVIEIEKKSGVARQRSEDKRIAALKSECSRQGLTYEDYLRLKREAEEQWYRSKTDGTIIIPRHQLAGAVVQAIGQSPKALRGPFTVDNFRALVGVGDFTTGLKEATGKFERFVKLEGSNQRSFQSNEFIGQYLDQGEPFEAVGYLTVPDDKTERYVKDLLNVAVTTIGIGACRKMGFGRGVIKSWAVVPPGEADG